MGDFMYRLCSVLTTGHCQGHDDYVDGPKWHLIYIGDLRSLPTMPKGKRYFVFLTVGYLQNYVPTPELWFDWIGNADNS